MRSLCGPMMFHGPQEEHPVQMVLTDGKTADVTIAEDPDSNRDRRDLSPSLAYRALLQVVKVTPPPLYTHRF